MGSGVCSAKPKPLLSSSGTSYLLDVSVREGAGELLPGLGSSGVRNLEWRLQAPLSPSRPWQEEASPTG